jgi:uncharacterized protein YutE (UPF0331/DUF86 family)
MAPPDDLPADRANRIADAVETIERNVVRLREFQHLSRAEYTADGAQDRRDAIERKFEKMTEAMVDIASELCKQERGTAPERRRGAVDILEAEDIVDSDLADRLREAIAFRDVLVHTYGPDLEEMEN